jgi:flagellar assembly factor FliW
MKVPSELSGATPAITSLVGLELRFPAGVLGFPQAQRFRLEPFNPGDAGDSPFFVLSALDEELSFIVLDPTLLVADYEVALSVELTHLVAARSAADLLPLAIVTVRDRLDDVTVNLQGPLVLNVASRLGAQAVLEKYPLRHPLVQPR